MQLNLLQKEQVSAERRYGQLRKEPLGTYAAVLHALGGMDQDFALVAKDDELGRKLQDLQIKTRGRATRGKQR